MDYAHIEKLVLKAKGGDAAAKEALAAEINYSAAYCKKTGILKKLKMAINLPFSSNYLN